MNHEFIIYFDIYPIQTFKNWKEYHEIFLLFKSYQFDMLSTCFSSLIWCLRYFLQLWLNIIC